MDTTSTVVALVVVLGCLILWWLSRHRRRVAREERAARVAELPKIRLIHKAEARDSGHFTVEIMRYLDVGWKPDSIFRYGFHAGLGPAQSPVTAEIARHNAMLMLRRRTEDLQHALAGEVVITTKALGPGRAEPGALSYPVRSAGRFCHICGADAHKDEPCDAGLHG